jgi:hypothetical protein
MERPEGARAWRARGRDARLIDTRGSHVRDRWQLRNYMLALCLTGLVPVVKSSHYLLTDPRELDILRPSPDSGISCNWIK